jgi:hypothetical protein
MANHLVWRIILRWMQDLNSPFRKIMKLSNVKTFLSNTWIIVNLQSSCGKTCSTRRLGWHMYDSRCSWIDEHNKDEVSIPHFNYSTFPLYSLYVKTFCSKFPPILLWRSHCAKIKYFHHNTQPDNRRMSYSWTDRYKTTRFEKSQCALTRYSCYLRFASWKMNVDGWLPRDLKKRGVGIYVYWDVFVLNYIM